MCPADNKLIWLEEKSVTNVIIPNKTSKNDRLITLQFKVYLGIHPIVHKNCRLKFIYLHFFLKKFNLFFFYNIPVLDVIKTLLLYMLISLQKISNWLRYLASEFCLNRKFPVGEDF